MPDARIDEIAPNVFRIASDIVTPDGGFSFNQYLIADDAPLLFHTGPRRLFEATRSAIARVIAPERLRYIGFSHVEADECGALNDFLAIAPEAQPLCGAIAAMTSVHDLADKPPHVMADGARLSLGAHVVRWIDAPHLPHGWESGLLFDESTKLLFCGDLFTQPGAGHAPLIESDILGPSEAFRGVFDYYAHAPSTAPQLEALAAGVHARECLARRWGGAVAGVGGAGGVTMEAQTAKARVVKDKQEHPRPSMDNRATRCVALLAGNGAAFLLVAQNALTGAASNYSQTELFTVALIAFLGLALAYYSLGMTISSGKQFVSEMLSALMFVAIALSFLKSISPNDA
jgi:glyoxylase-like metal-dependent hydrolase (beta-lactamase superfamily II)